MTDWDLESLSVESQELKNMEVNRKNEDEVI